MPLSIKYHKESKNENCCKKEDTVKKVFKGVLLDSLAVGEKSQVTKMNYVVGNYASPHQHPHEQGGEVIDVFTPLREDYL